MNNQYLRIVTAAGLVTGAVLGIAGTFAPSAELRSLSWGIDGIALVVSSALLVVYNLRMGREQLAAGFLVFLAGQTLIVSGAALELEASVPSFAAGAGLWAAGIALVSAAPVMPRFVRVTGAIAAILLAVTSVQLFAGVTLTPLSKPLPYGAYPFLAVTMVGWAWTHVRRPVRDASRINKARAHLLRALELTAR